MRLSFCVVSVITSVAFAAAPWVSSYEDGLARFRAGDYAAARTLLESALAEQPAEALASSTDVALEADYLPNLYLAIACYHQGDFADARRYLDAAEASGIAAGSAEGGPLFDHYDTLLGISENAENGDQAGTSDQVVTTAELASLGDFDRGAEVLDDEQLTTMTRSILTRCGFSPETNPNRAPWYFHYEMGLTLAEKGDLQRAVDALIAAAQRKPLPNRTARMYGMWFTDYRPYLEIAESHAGLGNWRCAFNALALSERTGEVGPTDDDETLERFRNLLQDCEAQLDETGEGQPE